MKLLRAFLVAAFLLGLLGDQGFILGKSTAASSFPANRPNLTTGQELFLPLILQPDPFEGTPAVWVHDGIPAPSEVGLFRHTFVLNSSAAALELQLFADTRYEVWLDGVWVGRGPARFTHTYHEYDVYNLGSLPAGSHLLAVLVEWAPNNRRAESDTPHLKALIQSGIVPVTSTGSNWKTTLANAWRADAALVHTWGLIGPTELLDLRQLPADWNLPAFADAHWQPAVSVNPPVAQIAARSIPLLVNVPMTATIQSMGLLSPGYAMGEIPAYSAAPYDLPFQATQAMTFTIETISQSPLPANFLHLNGSPLVWSAAGANRLDVYQTQASVSAGNHVLSFQSLAPDGVTFAIQLNGLQFPNFPFSQGIHAGRRTLLAGLVPAPSAVTASTDPVSGAMQIAFLQVPGYIVLDLGRTVYGRLVAQVDGSAGAVLDIGWDERLALQPGRPLPYPGSLHPQWNQVDSWVLDGSQRSISTIDARAGRYILIQAWGLGSVTLSQVQIYEERYPSGAQGGWFSSSDPLLNQIWQIGVDTLYPNLNDAYADAWRERGQWWGDTYASEKVNRVVFGSSALMRRGLLLMADTFKTQAAPGMSPNNGSLHMLDYAMLWVHSLAEYHLQTQDSDLLQRLYPTLVAFMDHLGSYQNANTGLLDLPQLPWSQTAYIDVRAYSSRFGQSTALNALYYGTLNQAAYLAGQVADTTHQTQWTSQAVNVKNSVNSYLYLPGEHRYLSTIDANNNPRSPGPHAQAWALAYQLVPQSEQTLVAQALEELISPDPALPNLEIYGMHWALEGLGRAGHITEALDLIRLYYGHLVNQGATTWWERFDAGQYMTASLSHPWGGAPTWFLTQYVLGASRTGLNSWQVQPALVGVSYAEGALPLDNGDLTVLWRIESCSAAYLEVQSSPNSSGEVILPEPGLSGQVSIDGLMVLQSGNIIADNIKSAGGSVHIALPGGFHGILISTYDKSCIFDY